MGNLVRIIKIGGKVIEEADTLSDFLEGFAKLEGLKILVHGGGRSATTLSEKLGIKAQMVDGRRITDAPTLEVVIMIYGGLVNKTIVAGLQAQNCNALGITGADMNCIVSEQRKPEPIDFGFVGDIVSVNADVFQALLHQHITPVIAPLTHDKKGRLLNTNADTIAARIAVAISKLFEVELYYCFEKKGVLRHAEEDESVIPLIREHDFRAMKEAGTVAGGMIPKLDNAFQTLNAGVKKVCILNHQAINELDTQPSNGTTLCL